MTKTGNRFDHLNNKDLASIKAALGGEAAFKGAIADVTIELTELAKNVKAGTVHLASDLAEEAVVAMVAKGDTAPLANSMTNTRFGAGNHAAAHIDNVATVRLENANRNVPNRTSKSR